MTLDKLAEKLFDAYNDQPPNPWKTFDGRDVPRWPDLSEQVREKWRAVAQVCDTEKYQLELDRDQARDAYAGLHASYRSLLAARDENSTKIIELRDKLWAKDFQNSVDCFMRAMDQRIPSAPTLDDYPFELRARLILEEALEFATAAGVHVAADTDDGELRIHSDSDARSSTGDVGLNEVSEDEPNWPEMIDALCDLLYVTYGAASAMGVDLAPFFKLVHEANMAKLSGPVRADGKRLKPEGWAPPDIAGLLAKIREAK
jgi:predicted HAD superfamily Cof-like phosphohydrolase